MIVSATKSQKCKLLYYGPVNLLGGTTTVEPLNSGLRTLGDEILSFTEEGFISEVDLCILKERIWDSAKPFIEGWPS